MRGRSILSDKKKCYFCGRETGLHLHHVFGGANRKKSDMDGCFCYLCYEDHMLLHDKGVGNEKLKAETQQAWMKAYRKNIDDFISRFGKNYMDTQP